jgi:hypothetical protein
MPGYVELKVSMSSGLRPGRDLTESLLPLASTQGVESKGVIVSGVDMLKSSSRTGA